MRTFSFLPIVLLIAALWVSPSAMAQPSMRQLFISMPDSILPTLTTNNRLDMVDFLDARMKAEVTNALDGKSRLTDLQADQLTLDMSEALSIRMMLLDIQQPVDSATQVIAVLRTYRLLSDSTATETVPSFYSLKWNPLSAPPRLTATARQLIESLPPSSILKRDDELIIK